SACRPASPAAPRPGPRTGRSPRSTLWESSSRLPASGPAPTRVVRSIADGADRGARSYVGGRRLARTGVLRDGAKPRREGPFRDPRRVDLSSGETMNERYEPAAIET